MSVAHNKFSLCHIFLASTTAPFFCPICFSVTLAYFQFFSSYFIQQIGSAVSFLFLNHFFTLPHTQILCSYYCYYVTLQSECLICVSTYEFASFFPFLSLVPLCFEKKNYVYIQKESSCYADQKKLRKKTDLLSELKLLVTIAAGTATAWKREQSSFILVKNVHINFCPSTNHPHIMPGHTQT